MDEVGAALIAIVLVLCAVFLPTLFLNGLAGAFYHQFAVTISAATLISLLVSLTLSPGARRDPAEAAQRRQARRTASSHLLAARGRPLQPRRSTRFSEGYSRLTHRLVPMPKRMMLAYAGLIAATVGLFCDHADRLHPGAGPGLFPDRHPAAAGLLARSHRRGDAQGRGAHPADPGRQGLGHARRLRRRVADAGAQRRRGLCSAAVVRGAPEARRHARRASWPRRRSAPPTSTKRG